MTVLALLLVGTRQGWTYNEWGNAATWFGAAGSLLAAGAALWIATTDRRLADDRERRTKHRAALDLTREAGLVRIQTGEIQAPVLVGPGDTRLGLTLRNWRKSALFDVQLERIVIEGQEISPVELERQAGAIYPQVGDKKAFFSADELARKMLDPGTTVSWVPKGISTAPELAVVHYTDDSGRRWEVDNTSTLARRIH
ncbi:hypothetical protein [Rhodococcus rhodochrous]|uniref:hypothetical protein n=1 Tax=Rhodococcus rhodochrous TaxID=1829 RepID=UPI00188AC525|nr:hypothetical protein [Rhodococcus rhodochrous]MBF4478290.1 hypothetical protein [Rhodococcus rhodochrous]